jgi:rod shape-determining protein MreD
MSGRNWLRLAAVLMAALIFQVAVLDQIVVLHAHADVMVLITAAAGLVAGPQRGAIVGFVTGIVADLVTPLPFGLSALTFTILGFALGMLRALPLGRDLASARVGACVAASVVGTALYAVIAALVHQHGVLSSQSADVVVVVGLGALILSLPVLALVNWMLAGSANPSFMPSGGSAIS